MRRRAAGLLVMALAPVLLAACGGGQDAADASTTGGALSADASLAHVAREFRRDGVLLGVDRLEDRFGHDALRIAAALAAPDDLRLFLAGAVAVFACPAELPAVVYVSPLFRSLLVTRWSSRNGVRLESVHAIPASDAAPVHWLDALPDASSASELLAARYAEALRRARDGELCVRTSKPATHPAPLIADDERDADLDRVADPSERLAELQRALAALLTDADAKPLETLGFDASRDELMRLATADPAVFPVPVSARVGADAVLLLYADWNVAGRYLLFGLVGGGASAGRGVAAGGVELVALPLER